MYKALLFDLDDTIFDFERCSRKALFETFQQLGADYNDFVYEQFRQVDDMLWSQQKRGSLTLHEVLEIRFKHLFERLNIKVRGQLNPYSAAPSDSLSRLDGSLSQWGDALYIEAQRLFADRLSNQFHLKPDAENIIERLSKRYPLYVASNGILEMQVQRLKLAKLLPYFTDVYVSDDIGYEKPNSKFFAECLRRSRLTPDDVLLIGDSLQADMVGGNNSAIDTCWYNPNKRSGSNVVAIKYEIKGLVQLTRILLAPHLPENCNYKWTQQADINKLL